ncbi:uncharacterized protein FA14DRAFT_156500 [Meira miltonrushii]|uniref:Uncharacterized protein n=1 Tax=Meira miltonrushii TaxID=1280837 RepID=A0A316V9T5_9BASI|nr:uncharacterized protein FA14DRAFT_156500 [Meira miltonrushii]PWN33818.1 hypothetical protein FA14DRAFT_156500 [Meira miltonrushii]
MATSNNEEDVFTTNNKQISPQSPTGSTTLRSIVERLEPSIAGQHAGMQEASLLPELVEVRKTPFGNVRVVSNPKEGNEGQRGEVEALGITITNPHPAFFEQARIACLSGASRFPIKQRTKYGRAELWQDGKIIYRHSRSECTLSIKSNGSNVALFNSFDAPLIDPILFKKLYTLASSWFTRFRQNLTIAQFLIPSNDVFAALVCQVRANGPEPDFEIHFVCHQKLLGLGEDIYVRVSRQRKRLVYNTKVGQQLNKQGEPWAWRYGNIPLHKKSNPSKLGMYKWSLDLSGSQRTPEMLSNHEFFAIQQALKMIEKVDSIFRISFDI